MTVIDINTGEIIKQYTEFPEHIYYAVKEVWDKYVREVTEWGIAQDKKLLYGKYDY